MSLINHIFFHDDLDGIISAAIFLDYKLRTEIGSLYRLYPVSSFIRGEKFNKIFSTITKNNYNKKIILDYQYHKDADLWIDHHYNSEFGECSIHNENIVYDPKSKSAAALTIALTGQVWSMSQSQINIINMIDSGDYTSVNQIFKDKGPIMILRAYLEKVCPSEMMYSRVVEVVANSYMNIENALIKLKIDSSCVVELEKNAFQIKKSMVIIKNMSIVHQKRVNQFPRYSEYFNVPSLKYSLRLTHIGNQNIYFQLGYNNWQDKSNNFNIGKILSELENEYVIRAGGHFNVGAGVIKEEY
jgi:hypothetical protein